MTGLLFVHFSWYTNSFLLGAFRQCCTRFLLENVLLEHILWGEMLRHCRDAFQTRIVFCFWSRRITRFAWSAACFRFDIW